MPTIEADDTILFADPNKTNKTTIFYDGESRPALIFQRQVGDTLWQGPLDLEGKAFAQNKPPAARARAKIEGDFNSDELSPGDAIQYGIVKQNVDRETLDPTKQAVDDDHFAGIVTIICLLTRPEPMDFIKDGNENTGGTFRFRQIFTGPTETLMLLEVGRSVPSQPKDKFGKWQLANVEHAVASPWGVDHNLEATPLWPGNLYASTILLINKQGEWQSLRELFVSLERTVTIDFTKLKVINDGDEHASANVQVSYEISEGDQGHVIKRFLTGFQEVTDGQTYALSYSHSIGPKTITEDTRAIGIRTAGQDEDGFLEASENAASYIKKLVIPTGRGKEVVTDRETTVHARPTSGDLEFEVTLKYSIAYT